jgi:superfamily II DNA/RNA helicase
VHAFAETSGKMVQENELFLRGLDQGVIIRKELMHELSAADDEEVIDELLTTSPHSESADNYNVPELRGAVQADRDVLKRLCDKARKVKPERDPKLAALVEELARVAADAKREAIDDEDQRRKQKVLVFSFYEDTVDWIESYLDHRLEKDKRLACYRGRMASVAGSDSRRGVAREAAIYGFAPESAGAPPGRRDDRFDLVLCTDVLAEGMNLQQCRNIINFDMPWNPMRLVQRHGRIDRIGSRHDRVFLRTYFPDKQLDALLNLEERVRRKLAQAAASVGVEVAPIERGAVGLQTFTEAREEIERLQRGDAAIYEAGGTQSAAQTGEEYRQELRKALERQRDTIEGLPWKAGSGMAKGTRRGHFFCATVGDRVYLRFVPYGDGPDAAIVSEIGTCLRMIECRERTPRVMPLELKQTAHGAWQRARQHVYEAWTHETDPAHLQPRVSKLNREIAEFLRTHPPVDVEQTRVERCLDAVEAPCSRREENLLRAVFDAHFPSHAAKSKALVDEVERIGLQPFAAPAPLPPIQPDEVHLICWLAIERASEQ